MSAADHDRAAILDRVAGKMWEATQTDFPVLWAEAKAAASLPGNRHIGQMVEDTRRQARAAVGALMIGADPRPEDVRLCMAGEHATGIVGGICAEAFDAMLAEVLE